MMWRPGAVNVAGVVRVIPSIAVLFLLLPSQGIGFRPSVIALTLLAIPPVLINTQAGMRGVDPATVEAGEGLGMSGFIGCGACSCRWLCLSYWPGCDIAAVEVIASATLATFIGGGWRFHLRRPVAVAQLSFLWGALPVALLAFGTGVGLSYLQRAVAQKG